MSVDHAALHTTARDRLFTLLKDLEWHDIKECQKAGGVRYSARLLELKRLGYEIESKTDPAIEDGKQYRLKSLTPGAPQAKQVKIYLTEAEAESMLLDQTNSPSGRAKIKAALLSFRANKHKL